jgi:uncharacterized protein
MRVQVGSAIAEPGRRSHGYLEIGSMADGSPVRVPVTIAAGRDEGPVVWAQGCIHGDEYGSAAALIELARELDLEQMRGTLIALPAVNPSAFNLRARLSTLDGGNLNRVFPAAANGSFSFQVGAALAEAMKANATHLLDLHSGGPPSEVPVHMIYMEDGSPTAHKSKLFAKSLGAEVVWRGRTPDGYAAALIGEASRAGIPGVLVENGGGQFPTEQQVERYKACLYNGFKALGMLPGRPVLPERYTMVGNARYLHSRRGGLFVRNCEVGAILEPGAAIGGIISLHGGIDEEFTSPFDAPAFIGGLRTSYFPTHVGDMVCEILEVEGYEEADHDR